MSGIKNSTIIIHSRQQPKDSPSLAQLTLLYTNPVQQRNNRAGP